MKKKLLFIPLMAGFFMSANADVTVQDVAGTYTGKLQVYFLGVDPDTDESTKELASEKDEVEVLTTVNDGKLIFMLSDFEIMEIPVGNVEVKDVEIDNAGNITPITITLDKEKEGLGTLPTTLTGTLSSTNANLNINVVWNYLPIDVVYVGTKPITNNLISQKEDIQFFVEQNRLIIGGSKVSAYSIYNIQGKHIKASSNIRENVIDFNSLNDGVYIVKVDTENGSIVKKIIKR